MNTLRKTLFPLLALMFVLNFSGCKKDGCDTELSLDVDQAQLEADIEAIDAYLAEKGIEAQIHPSGLRYVINNAGSGKTANLCSTVFTAYEGRRMSDGFRFERRGTPISFTLSGVIKGWQIGIPLIKPTGNIDLYIPSVYAYGSRGSGSNIPPNANLTFNISLTEVR